MAERFGPIILSIIAVYLYYVNLGSNQDIYSKVCLMLQTTGAASATLLGFFLTVATIIHAIPTKAMSIVRQNKVSYDIFIGYLKQAVAFCIVVVTVSFLDAFIQQIRLIQENIHIYMAIVVWLCFYSWLISIRFTYFFITLLYSK